MNKIHPLLTCAGIAIAVGIAPLSAAEKPVRLMTLDPGHFHAALVQKSMYPDVDAEVHVFAPDTQDLDLHLARIEGFNQRDKNPTAWTTKVHRSDDSLDEMIYALKGVHCKVSVVWKFQAPKGAKDTHYSLMQGTRCALIIRQGAAQHYKPTLYIEPTGSKDPLEKSVKAAIAQLQKNWPGVTAKPIKDGWEVVIPKQYKVGHEGHFSQVTQAYLGYLKQGKLPDWEVPNMLVKYQTIMEAYQLSRKK